MLKDFIGRRFKHDRRCVSTWIIYFSLIFFKIMGLFTLTVENESYQRGENLSNINIKPSKPGIVYNVVLVILWLLVQSFTLRMRELFEFPGKSTITINTSNLHFILSVVMYAALLLSYCVNQTRMVQLGKELMEIEKQFGEVEMLRQRQRITRRTVLKGVMYWLFLFFLLITSNKQYLDNSRSPTVIYCWLLDMNVLLVSCFCVMQYYLAVGFIRAKFVRTNNFLELLLTSFKLECTRRLSNGNRQLISGTSFVAQIMFLTDVCNHLLKISDIINETFSVPILISLTYLFCCLLNTAFYSVVILVANGAENLINVISPISCILCIGTSISLLSFTVTGLKQEVAKTAYISHNILNSTNDQKLTTQLKLFSLQLLHEKPNFTACGFFDLDCSLLQSMIGAFTTYIVILVQFQTSST